MTHSFFFGVHPITLFLVIPPSLAFDNLLTPECQYVLHSFSRVFRFRLFFLEVLHLFLVNSKKRPQCWHYLVWKFYPALWITSNLWRYPVFSHTWMSLVSQIPQVTSDTLPSIMTTTTSCFIDVVTCWYDDPVDLIKTIPVVFWDVYCMWNVIHRTGSVVSHYCFTNPILQSHTSGGHISSYLCGKNKTK